MLSSDNFSKSKNLGYDYLNDRDVLNLRVDIDFNFLYNAENLDDTKALFCDWIDKIKIQYPDEDWVIDYEQIGVTEDCCHDEDIRYFLSKTRFETEDEFIVRMNKLKKNKTDEAKSVLNNFLKLPFEEQKVLYEKISLNLKKDYDD